MMFFHDAAGERKAKTGAISLGGEERPEDIGQVPRRDTATGVADNHRGAIASRTDIDTDGALSVHGLHCIEEQIQKHLVNLIAVVLDFGCKAGVPASAPIRS